MTMTIAVGYDSKGSARMDPIVAYRNLRFRLCISLVLIVVVASIIIDVTARVILPRTGGGEDDSCTRGMVHVSRCTAWNLQELVS